MTQARQEFILAQQRMLERYEVTAQSRFVDVASINGKAHVLVTGDGPAVVMVAGIGTPGSIWAPLAAHLGGFRLFLVDLPGYGLTDTTDDFAGNLRQGAVGFLEELLDGLELDAPHFVANSLGSLWTMWLALDRPARAARMVHVGCPGVILGSSAPLQMRLLSVKPVGRFLTWLQPPSGSQVEQLSRMVNEHPLAPELADLLLATERLAGFREMFLATLHVLLRLRGSRPELRLSAGQLAQIHQQTLLVWGEDDPFGSAEVGEQVASAMPTAELIPIAGGHAPWLSKAEQIGPSIVDFLRRDT